MLTANARKLTTARTLALSGDVTGSTTFDGSANKTIAATLKNSGVTAGTYGALDLVTKNNGTVWVSNNAGLHGTSAISTWTARQDCKISFRWRVSSESTHDYLNITAAGTQILANTSGSTEQTGILTVELAANKTIVFTYRKDGSANNGIDRAEISEVKYGAGTADPSTVIYESNIENYFEITNSSYGFYPAIPIPNITVDAKGRITKIQTVYMPSVIDVRHSNGSYKEGIRTEAVGLGSHAEGGLSIANANALRIKLAYTSTNEIRFDSTYSKHIDNFNKLSVNMPIYVLNRINRDIDKYTIKSINTENNSIIVNETVLSSYAGSCLYHIFFYTSTDNSIADCIHVEGDRTFAGNWCAHSEGSYTAADGSCAHAEGWQTTSTGNASHSEGSSSKSSGHTSHAEGGSIASGDYSHAEGGSTASGECSHAEGDRTQAIGDSSHSGGYYTIAKAMYQTAIGKYNKESTAETDKFIIGNGTSNTARSNCLRVTNTSGVYSNSTFKSSGADYAEMLEWLDGNVEKEDRTGLFVTLEKDKIRVATPEDDYILGIVSACPSVCGDVRDDTWGNMHLTDIYGQPVLEEVEIPERTEEIVTIDEEGEEVTETVVMEQAHTEIRQKLNPEYDNTKEYIPRSERPEWDAVGVLGKLVAIDDGSCEENGWCKVGEGGIATISKQKTRFRVMKRLDQNHIKIFIL